MILSNYDTINKSKVMDSFYGKKIFKMKKKHKILNNL